MTDNQDAELVEKLENLTSIGIALSTEKDSKRLLESILIGAKKLTCADGGTLYSVQDNHTVKMEILRTDSLGYAMGGTTGTEIPFSPIDLYDDDGKPNHHMVVTHSVLQDTTVNIPDAYDAEGFDFSGTIKFDQNTGYRSKSFLTVPLKNHIGEIIGVLQLLNATDPKTNEVIPFSNAAQRLTESLASQAAISLTNRRLIDDLQNLFESLIQLIATAIDEKSPYTAGHCKRVPLLTMMLAEAAHESELPELSAFKLNSDDRYELRVASWLHDCGKITTPEHIVDKATKLSTIFDRIEVIRCRFEIVKRDAQIAALEAKLSATHFDGKTNEFFARIDSELQQQLQELDEEFIFLKHCNIGGEFMSDGDQSRVKQISLRKLTINDKNSSLLSQDELYNLTIAKGTLLPSEREVINNHIVATIKMLESLPLPKHLKNIPEYAGGHHEKMDGTGYPKGLKGHEMSMQARIMAIADIFEALTARDRPYKDGKKLSEALKILGYMKKDGHIDPVLFKLFIDSRIYLKYAQEFIDPHQIDEVIPSQIPGYNT